MSRSKKICVLLGVFLAACVVTFGVSRYEIYKEEIQNSNKIILELAEEEVTALSWEYGQNTMAFHKEERWLYDEDGAFPVDREKIQKLLEPFQELGASFVIENVEDYGQYGLDAPSCTIHITTEEDHEIRLGDYSAMDEERYVSIGDGNVYLVKDDPMARFDVELSDLILQDKIPEFGQITGIQFAGEEHYSVVCEEDSGRSFREEDKYFVEVNGTDISLDTEQVENYIQSIRFLNLTEYAAYDASEEELSDYGLEEPELSVTLDYMSGEAKEETVDTFTLAVSRDPAEKEILENNAEGGGEDEEITAYARVDHSQIIYKITTDEYKELMDASYDRLRHQEILPVDFEDICQIELTLEGAVHVLIAENRGNERIWYYEEKELETVDFQNALERLRADGFTDEEPSQKEEIRLTISLDDENNTEIRIELYRYDGSHCLAVVDGETVSFVPRSSVVDIVEAVQAIVLD